MFKYIPITDEDKEKMLSEIGVESVGELFSDIPNELKLNRDLNLETSKSEIEVLKKIKSIAKENNSIDNLTCFLGAGAYDHYIPSVIKHITSRSEFYTAYTPYQGEISQGTLQTIFEFQSMISELTGMDIANASMYDGATASVEACVMALNSGKNKNKILVAKSINPEIMEVIKTYMKFKAIEVIEIDYDRKTGRVDVDSLKANIDKESACMLVQSPNFFGIIEEMEEIESITHQNKAMLIMNVNPISLGVLKSPGELGADIAVGEAQPLGNSLNFGGPFVGFMSTKSKNIRKLPGRIVGETIDSRGQRAYVLTLQAREQHIRREKATSNICSNQALNALSATIYMATMGYKGLKEVANQCIQKSHYACNELAKTGEYEKVFTGEFFNEFTVKSKYHNVDSINEKLLKENIIGGFNLENKFKELNNCSLYCVTEKRSKDEIDNLVNVISSMGFKDSKEKIIDTMGAI